MTKPYTILYIPLVIIAIAVLNACINPDSEIKKELGMKELERAIAAIEDRREAELRIIEEQNEMILTLNDNLEAANSDGMKDAIGKNIAMKKLAIQKAEKNLLNQDVVLANLYQKKDSLLKLVR